MYLTFDRVNWVRYKMNYLNKMVYMIQIILQNLFFFFYYFVLICYLFTCVSTVNKKLFYNEIQLNVIYNQFKIIQSKKSTSKKIDNTVLCTNVSFLRPPRL